MPALRPGEGIGKQGGIDEASYLAGSWSYIGVVQGGSEHEIGNAPEGVFTMSREEFEHQNTAFPRRTDVIATVRVGMMFEGRAQEIHRENVHLLWGDLYNNTSFYVYGGGQRDCTFFTFSAKRLRICDKRTVEVYMWKCLSRGLFQLGEADEVIGTPFQFTALDDEGNDFGGSATAPLGYIYLPAKLT